jgi:hypothetical protein
MKIITQDQADKINKQVEVYEHDLMFAPDKLEANVHVFWSTPMGGLQIGVIEYDDLLNGWFFVPNMVTLKRFTARQLIAIGHWTNELNRIVYRPKIETA